MKKILSLFISIVLLITISFSFAVQASTPLQIKPCITGYDTKAADEITFVYNVGPYQIKEDGVVIGQLYDAQSRSVENSYAGYNNVIKYTGSSSKNPYIQFYVLDENDARLRPTSGILKFNASFLTSGELKDDKRHFRLYANSPSADLLVKKLYEDSDSAKIIPNIWYDIDMVLDLDSTSDNVKLVLTPKLSAASSAEISDYTISHTGTYYRADNCNINYIRIDFVSTTPSDPVYWADIRTAYYAPGAEYNKAEIVSIGSGGEVAHSQNNISVKLSDDIPGLKKEHILIENSNGQNVEISSMGITSDGTYYYANITTENPLPAWTQYTLTIQADAWGKGSLQTDGVTDTAVTATSDGFYTPSAPFDMKDPVFGMSDGNLTIDTTLINTTGTPEDVTILIVTYDNEGRLKSLDAVSYEDFEAAYPGENKHIEASIASGDNIRLIAMNGWSKMTALFGKYWTTSYAELNP